MIIPSLDRPGSLRLVLEDLRLQSYADGAFEVLVVDDGSSSHDPYRTFESEYGKHFDIRVLRTVGVGPGAARNVGVASARGEILAFTEDDVRLDTRWLEHAAAAFADADVDVVEGETLDGDTEKPLRKGEGRRRQVPAFIPCNLFMRRRVFEDVGGYDESYFDHDTKLYFREDTDLGLRLLEMGARVVIVEDVVVRHPPQFVQLKDCRRHVARLGFDALLFSRHRPELLSLVDVKHLGPLSVRRPLHKAAHVHVVSTVGAVYWALRRRPGPAAACIGTTWLTASAYRYRYEGSKALRMYEVVAVGRYWGLPFRYAAVLVHQCVKLGNYRALRP